MNTRNSSSSGNNNTTTSNRPAWLLQYDLIGKIGEGTYGLVFLAKIKSQLNRGKSIAIKKFKQSKDGDGISPTAIREIMLLREINHENVVKLVNVHINSSDMSLYLAFDYAEHDLYVIFLCGQCSLCRQVRVPAEFHRRHDTLAAVADFAGSNNFSSGLTSYELGLGFCQIWLEAFVYTCQHVIVDAYQWLHKGECSGNKEEFRLDLKLFNLG